VGWGLLAVRLMIMKHDERYPQRTLHFGVGKPKTSAVPSILPVRRIPDSSHFIFKMIPWVSNSDPSPINGYVITYIPTLFTSWVCALSGFAIETMRRTDVSTKSQFKTRPPPYFQPRPPEEPLLSRDQGFHRDLCTRWSLQVPRTQNTTFAPLSAKLKSDCRRSCNPGVWARSVTQEMKGLDERHRI